jgi:hypothetical protein
MRATGETPVALSFLFNIENLVFEASPDRREHSAWRIAKKKSKGEMVNGEQQQSQRIVGLPFTVY